ncbi:MAG: hypothetical protein ACR2P5_08240 [Gammaproteobacteria bacterium]
MGSDSTVNTADQSCRGANEIVGAVACETCPTGEIADGTNRRCENPNAPCVGDRGKDGSNLCVCMPSNGVAQRPSILDRNNCVNTNCGGSEPYRDPADDECKNCAGNLVTNGDRNGCECAQDMRLRSGQTEQCVPETCGLGEIRVNNPGTAEHDTCMACDSAARMRSNADAGAEGTQCIPCMGDLVPDENGNMCACPAAGGKVRANDGGSTADNDSCTCPMDTREADGDSSRCVPEICTANQVRVDMPGEADHDTCLTCTGDLDPNTQNNVCVCPFGQSRENAESDMCACPDNMKKADGDPDRCVPETCRLNQIRVDNSGEADHDTCMACDAGMRSNADSGMEGTQCMSCPNDLTPDANGNMCECPSGQSRDSPGSDSCSCPDNTRKADGDPNRCVPEICGESEIRINIPGAPDHDSCTICTGNLRQNGDNTGCVCPMGQSLQSQRSNICECPEGMKKAAGDPDQCVPEICELNQVRVSDDTCMTCDDGMVSGAVLDGAEGTGECMRCTGVQVPNANGNACMDCPAGMRHSNNEKCVPAICEAGEMRVDDSTADNHDECMACGAGEVSNAQTDAGGAVITEGTSCMACAQGLLPAGNMCMCPDADLRLSTAGSMDTCVPRECELNQVRAPDDTCMICGEGMVSGMVAGETERTACMRCTGVQVPNPDGVSCMNCPADMRHSNNEKCVPMTCEADEMRVDNSAADNHDECVECGASEVSNAQTDAGGAVITEGTSCMACAQGLFRNPAGNMCMCTDADLRLSTAGSMDTCVPRECELNEIRMSSDDSCMACGDGMVSGAVSGGAEGTACTSCRGVQAPNADGNECVNCPADMRHSNNEKCVPALCDGDEMRVDDSAAANHDECVECGVGEISNAQTDARGAVIIVEGTACTLCTGELGPDALGNMCVCKDSNLQPAETGSMDTCVPRECALNEVRDSDNACMACGDGTVSGAVVGGAEGTGACIPCTGVQVPNANGNECVNCPADMRHSNNEKCVPALCDADEIRVDNSAADNHDECMACGANEVSNAQTNAGGAVITEGTSCAECTGALNPNTARNMCVCDDNTMRPARTGNMNTCVPKNCAAGETRDEENDMCASSNCVAGEIRINNPGAPDHDTCMACVGGLKANGDNNGCVPQTCALNQVRISDESCRTCTGNTVSGATSAAEGMDACIPCTGQLDPNPSGNMCACPPGMQLIAGTASACEAVAAADENKNAEYAAAIGGAAFIGALIYNYYIGGAGVFQFTPSYAFSRGGGESAYSAGGRLEYADKELTAFWGAGRAPDSGNLIYASGMKYAKDFWSIAYAAETEKDETEYQISADIRYEDGIFAYRSGLAGEYGVAEGASQTTDSRSLVWRNAVELNYQGWKITPLANVYWGEYAATDFRLNLRYEF